MSEEHKEKNNKRKVKEPKSKLAAKKPKIEDILDRIKTTLVKQKEQENEIESESKKIDEKYAAQFKTLDDEIEKLEAEKRKRLGKNYVSHLQNLNEEIKRLTNLKNEVDWFVAQETKQLDEEIENLEDKRAKLRTHVIEEKNETEDKLKYGNLLVDETIVEDLNLIIKEKKTVIYPNDADSNDECLYGLLNNIIAGAGVYDFTYEHIGISEEDRKGFKKFVDENIEFLDGEATLQMRGKVEHPDDTEIDFEPIDDYEIVVKGETNTIKSESISWELVIDDYYPSTDEIEWPKSGTGWATANVKIDVLMLKLKKV